MTRLVLLAALALSLAAPAAAGDEAFRATLLNADFSLPPTLPSDALDTPRTQSAAAFWDYRVLSGQRAPMGSATWGDGIVEIGLDPRDAGPHTATLMQTLGHRDRACVNEEVATLRVHVAGVSDAPVRLHLFIGEPGRAALHQSTPVELPAGHAGAVDLQLPPVRCAATLALAFGADAPGSLRLDGVEIVAGRVSPHFWTGVGPIGIPPPAGPLGP